jgi:hypothetical protein
MLNNMFQFPPLPLQEGYEVFQSRSAYYDLGDLVGGNDHKTNASNHHK